VHDAKNITKDIIFFFEKISNSLTFDLLGIERFILDGILGLYSGMTFE